jgi:hypothetical protein
MLRRERTCAAIAPIGTRTFRSIGQCRELLLKSFHLCGHGRAEISQLPQMLELSLLDVDTRLQSCRLPSGRRV